MVGVGVIEADDVLAALAPFALNADEFLRIDVVAVVRRVVARVAAACDPRNRLRSIIVEAPKQHTATLVGIGLLAVLTNRKVVGLRELKHQKNHFTTESQSHRENQEKVFSVTL